MKIAGSGVGWGSFHWLQKGLDDLSSRVASTGSTSPPSPPPLLFTHTPPAHPSTARVPRARRAGKLSWAGDNYRVIWLVLPTATTKAIARLGSQTGWHSLGIQIPLPSPWLQLWFLGLLQFYVQFFALFSFFRPSSPARN